MPEWRQVQISDKPRGIRTFSRSALHSPNANRHGLFEPSTHPRSQSPSKGSAVTFDWYVGLFEPTEGQYPDFPLVHQFSSALCAYATLLPRRKGLSGTPDAPWATLDWEV